jgi:hypothetical protein
MCEEAYLAVRRSSQPVSNMYLQYLFGLLPYKFIHPAMKLRLWTGNIVILPGSLEYLSIAEHPVEDMYFSSASDSGMHVFPFNHFVSHFVVGCSNPLFLIGRFSGFLSKLRGIHPYVHCD